MDNHKTFIQKEYPDFEHFTDAVGTIKKLKREGEHEKLEKVLIWCINETEEEARLNNHGVAPYYYEELAKLNRKRKDYRSEVIILERYASQPHAPGSKPPQLLKRLQKASELAAKNTEHKS